MYTAICGLYVAKTFVRYCRVEENYSDFHLLLKHSPVICCYLNEPNCNSFNHDIAQAALAFYS